MNNFLANGITKKQQEYTYRNDEGNACI